MSKIIIGRTLQMTDKKDNEALDEAIKQITDSMGQYGSGAPSSNTPGTLYFDYSVSPVRVWLKVSGTWQ